MWKDLLDLWFPRNCPGCDRSLVKGEVAVCLNCLTELSATGDHLHLQANPLYDRLAGRVQINGALAGFYFDKHGRTQKLLQALKYGNQPRVGLALGRTWGHGLAEVGALHSLQGLVPVPLHPARQRERGYNQAERIAAGLGEALGVPVLDGVLQRVKRTESQTRKNRQERWENVREVFRLAQPVEGHVALVDDVATTGATLEACVQTLQLKGGNGLEVTVMSLCMAQHL